MLASRAKLEDIILKSQEFFSSLIVHTLVSVLPGA